MKYFRYSHVIRRLDLSIVSFGTKTLPLNYTLIVIFKRDCEILHCDFDEQRLNYFLKNKNENNCYYYKADKIRINGEKFKYSMDRNSWKNKNMAIYEKFKDDENQKLRNKVIDN